VKAGWFAGMSAGTSLLRLGVGDLICCWQHANNTTNTQTIEPKMRRAMPRKFPLLSPQVRTSG
jgi:hypothetical protein